MVLDTRIRESIFHDITHFGVRAAAGTIFIVHSLGKFDPGFTNFLSSVAVPAEMQYPIGLAELIGGILLISGILTRISSSILAIDMLGAIFYVKHASSLTGQRGIEFEMLLLAANLYIIVAGPGRVSISHLVKKIPRFLQ